MCNIFFFLQLPSLSPLAKDMREKDNAMQAKSVTICKLPLCFFVMTPFIICEFKFKKKHKTFTRWWFIHSFICLRQINKTCNNNNAYFLAFPSIVFFYCMKNRSVLKYHTPVSAAYQISSKFTAVKKIIT